MLATGQDDRLSRRAVAIAWSVLKDGEPNRFVDWGEDLAARWPQASFTGLARLLEAAVFIAQGQADVALKTLEWVKSTYPGTDLHRQALVVQAHIYALDLRDLVAARQTVDEFESLFGHDPLLAVAEDALGWSEENYLPKQSFPAGQTAQTVPESCQLDPNYPNPFNPSSTIAYHLPRATRVTIEIYNLAGRKVVTLIDRLVEAGYHTVRWDGRDGSGRTVGAGIYFCRMRAGGFTAVRKMTLLP